MEIFGEECDALALLAEYGEAIERVHWNGFASNDVRVGRREIIEALAAKGLCRIDKVGESTFVAITAKGREVLAGAPGVDFAKHYASVAGTLRKRRT